MSGPTILNPGVATGAETNTNEKPLEWPLEVEKVPIPIWDTGVFITELANLDKLPTKFTDLSKDEKAALVTNPEVLVDKAQKEAPEAISEGTYRGTQLALTKIYSLIEQSYTSFMDTANFEPSLPAPLTIEQKRKIFQFTDPATDGYPPHLNVGAPGRQADTSDNPTKKWSDSNPGQFQKTTLGPGDMFNKMRLAQLPSLLPQLLPKTFLGRAGVKVGEALAWTKYGSFGRPDEGQRIADIEEYNNNMRARGKGIFAMNDVFDLPNIGDLQDWWSDARFSQQHFTGTNPTTIQRATEDWLNHFASAASNSPADQKMEAKIKDLIASDRDSLYMQDYSYFRKYAGIPEGELIQCEYDYEYNSGSGPKKEKRLRYSVAPVCLFHLPKEGQLQPLAIVIDWRGSAEKSVTIYNKNLTRSEQQEDWPWRYAKTCVQSADWLRHEMTVHLTLTHMVEEATIVAAQRAFVDTHPVFQLLYPHWQKTLSLNAAARATLVPYVIFDLVGFNGEQAKSFVQSEFNNFDFKGRYVPEDLKSRGFDPEKRNDPKYVNYAYARCIYTMWSMIRKYVKTMLLIHYGAEGADPDTKVREDHSIKDWYTSMQGNAAPLDGGAGLKSFPTITTFTELVDAVTMCIHLASPQHTAVNYLQNYYQAFVINKPPSLYREPPNTRAKLDSFVEQDLVDALPINHPREWLLSSHIPYLLSFKPGDKESLIIYAASKYHLYKAKKQPDEIKIKEAAAQFYADLASTEKEFKKYSTDTWDSADIKYDVLSPSWNAVSILI